MSYSNCYENINEDIYTRYAVLIDNQIQYAKQTEYDSYQDTLKSQNDLRNASLVILIAVVVLFILIDVIVQSSSDPLTKVGNRRALNSKLARYNRSRREYSVIMIDIDNFKKVNDTYGHEKGDEVLATLGIILNEEKKVGYTPYRYGGEEFLFLVDSINTGEVVKFADRIRYLMENQVIEGMDEKITISIGVGSRTEGIDDVVRVADDNLYFSKQHGKNVVTFLDDDEPTVYNSFCFKYL